MVANPDWNNPNKWTRIPEVVGFLEHERRVHLRDKKGEPLYKNGKPVIEVLKFTKRDLEEYARNCNERDRLNQPSPLTLGHTRDGVAEKDQPDIVGYGRRFRVVFDRERGVNVVLFDAYFHPDQFARAQEFPRLSPEVWKGKNGKKILDPISLLKSSTPQLDLGQWTFERSRSNGRLRYAMLSYAMSRHEDLGTYRVRYAAEEIPGEDLPPPRGGEGGGGGGGGGRGPSEDEALDMEDTPPNGGGGGNGGGGFDDGGGERGIDEDDLGPEGLEQRSPGFYRNFCDSMGHYTSKGKVKNGMGEGPGFEPSAAGPSLPSPTNAMPGRGAPPPDDQEQFRRRGKPQRGLSQKERERMNRQSEETQLMRFMRSMDARMQRMESNFAAAGEDREKYRYQAEAAHCERRLVTEVEQQGYVINRPKNVEAMIPMSEEQRDEHIADLQKYSRLDPAADRYLPVASDAPVLEHHEQRDGTTTVRAAGGVEGRGGPPAQAELTEAQLDKALAYQRRHGMDKIEEADQYARGLRTLDGAQVGRNGSRR